MMEGEIIISFTKKDSKVVICTLQDYNTVAKVHISRDVVVIKDSIEPTITLRNRLSKQLVQMFRIGYNGSSGLRSCVVKAPTLKDTVPPPISFLWKTDKEYT